MMMIVDFKLRVFFARHDEWRLQFKNSRIMGKSIFEREESHWTLTTLATGRLPVVVVVVYGTFSAVIFKKRPMPWDLTTLLPSFRLHCLCDLHPIWIVGVERYYGPEGSLDIGYSKNGHALIPHSVYLCWQIISRILRQLWPIDWLLLFIIVGYIFFGLFRMPSGDTSEFSSRDNKRH